MLETTPAQNVEQAEFQHCFFCFCTLISLLSGKKMNYPTVFIKLLESERVREIFKLLINEESDFEAITKFIQAEPSIAKSKYVTKYLNKFKKPLL